MSPTPATAKVVLRLGILGVVDEQIGAAGEIEYSGVDGSARDRLRVGGQDDARAAHADNVPHLQ